MLAQMQQYLSPTLERANVFFNYTNGLDLVSTIRKRQFLLNIIALLPIYPP